MGKNKIKHIEENFLSITDLILLFAKNIKIIVITPSIFVFLMILNVVFFSKPIYTSTSKIMSSSNGGGLSQAAGIAAQFGFNISNKQSEPKWVYPEIIKSRTLAKSMLKRKFEIQSFKKNITLFDYLTEKDKKNYNYNELEILAVEKFLKMINVNEDIKTSILTLNINASDPKFAADLNHALIEQLDNHQKKYNKAKTSDAKEFIIARIIDTEKELISAEEDLKVFRDRNRRIENSPALLLEQQRLGREVTVLTGVFTTLKQQLETTKIEEVKDSDYVVILDPPEIPLKRSKPNKKRLVILAFLFGFLLSLIIIFLIEFYNKSEEKEKFDEAKKLIKSLNDMINMKLK